MKRRNLVAIGLLLTAVLVLAIALPALAQSRDLAAVRSATARFHRPEVAQEAGYDLLEGLDHCFNNPGTGAMGYHYIDAGLLDTTVAVTEPEAMVYAPGPNGQLQLAAVEYIVPADQWDEEELPSLMSESFHLNEALGVYVLHAWIWKNNPSGMFEDWNPTVSCPAE